MPKLLSSSGLDSFISVRLSVELPEKAKYLPSVGRHQSVQSLGSFSPNYRPPNDLLQHDLLRQSAVSHPICCLETLPPAARPTPLARWTLLARPRCSRASRLGHPVCRGRCDAARNCLSSGAPKQKSGWLRALSPLMFQPRLALRWFCLRLGRPRAALGRLVPDTERWLLRPSVSPPPMLLTISLAQTRFASLALAISLPRTYCATLTAAISPPQSHCDSKICLAATRSARMRGMFI